MEIYKEGLSKSESSGAYGNRLRSLLKTRWQNLLTAEIINAAALCLGLQDRLSERLALTNDIETEDQFQSEM